jgi:uncharacterized BrkB/YihY/UPF0761 family membrane protein
MLFMKMVLDYEVPIQLVAAVLFLLGTLLLAFSHEPFSPRTKKDSIMPMRVIRWRFRVGVIFNWLGFSLIALCNIVRLSI